MHTDTTLARGSRRPSGRALALAAATLLATVPIGVAVAQARLGGSQQGALADGDRRLESGEYLDSYTVQGRAGQRLVVRMRSDAFDPYLMIRGPQGFAEDNDDAPGGGANAELDVRLPANGAYEVIATSFQPGERGAYIVELGAGGDRVEQTAGRLRGGQPDAGAQSADPGPIESGRAVRGALAWGDATLQSGEFADSWTLRGRRGQRFTIRMNSSEFDTYILARGPGDLAEDNDDEDGERGSTDSRLTVTLPADGEMQVIATSYQPGERGSYTLVVEGEGAGGDRPQQQAQAAPAGGALRIGATTEGALAREDRQRDTGQHLDSYSLRGRRGQQLELRMESTAIDPLLRIEGPGGFAEFNDDDVQNGSTNSRLLVTLPADGEYRVTASSYAAGETGAYRLAVAETQAMDPGQGSSAGAEGLRVGGDAAGQLAQGDETLRSGEFVDRYRFRGRAGQRVAIEARAEGLDTYLILVSPSGSQEDNDDQAEGNTNARLETQLNEDGEYSVLVTSYQPGETGAYQVSLAEAGSAPPPQAERPRPGGERPSGEQPQRTQFRPAGGHRVFAVLVGISDYGGTANNLSWTDEDASKLGDALRRGGTLAPESVVLTNAQATRAAVRAAFQRVAAAAGPDDVFLFFFSGHGSQNPVGEGGNELDGQDETIVMRDGDITDDELAGMFAQVRTRTAILALDACFAGGFARDVVSRPGVMGLFSSEEDLTSAVAQKFEAGGYLSHFLRTGLQGEADGNNDSAITAGELSAYLFRRWAEEDIYREDATTGDDLRGYQNLVVDRGGVRLDEVLLG